MADQIDQGVPRVGSRQTRLCGRAVPLDREKSYLCKQTGELYECEWSMGMPWPLTVGTLEPTRFMRDLSACAAILTCPAARPATQLVRPMNHPPEPTAFMGFSFQSWLTVLEIGTWVCKHYEAQPCPCLWWHSRKDLFYFEPPQQAPSVRPPALNLHLLCVLVPPVWNS